MAKNPKRRPNRLLTDAFREIKHTKSRFISLMVLSALAVCFLAGLRATAPDMKLSADRYFDRQQLMDLRVVSTLALTDEDIEVLANFQGVESAVGAYTLDAILPLAENDHIVKLHSITDGVNLPRLREGRLPEKGDEILIEPLFVEETGLAIGDTVELDTGDGDFEDALKYDRFTVVGIADSPLYISVDRGSSSLGTGRVSAFVQVPEEAFDLEAYTDAYLKIEGAAELATYSQAYEDLMEAQVDSMEDLADRRADHRYDEILAEANEKLADAEQELADAKEEVAQELGDAKNELDDARKKLDDGWREYWDGSKELDQEVADAEQELADAEKELADAKVKLEDARADLDEGWDTYYENKADYDEGLLEYRKGKIEFDDGKRRYEEGLAELEDGWDQLHAARHQLEQGQDQYEQGAQLLKQLDQTVFSMVAGQLAPMGITTSDEMMQALAQGDPAVTAIVDGTLAGVRSQSGTLFDALDGLLQMKAAGMPIPPEALAPIQAQVDSGMLPAPILLPVSGALQVLQNPEATPEQLQGATAGIAQARASINMLPQSSAELVALKKKLDSSHGQLSSGWDAYYEARKELYDARAELDEAKEELDENEGKLTEAFLELTDAKRQLAEGYEELTDGEVEYADGVKEYEDGLAELADGRQELADKVADAKIELADAKAELLDGEQEYRDGLAEYEDGKAEAAEEIADAEEEIAKARRDVAEIEECQWYLLDRNTNMGYMSYSMDADRMGNLAAVFPLIFFLVAALVCLTTMTRMVEEQRVAIGGLKALGYTRGAIAIKYVGYGFLASAIGALIGLAIGLTLLPWIICSAWAIMYTTGEIYYSLEPLTSVLACSAAIGTVTLSALVACFNALTAVPAQLMRPKAPPMGKRILLERITPLWRRLSFNYKITLRNLFRYKRRFWMTVIGIGGCASLIVTAFGLRDSLFDVMDRQYDVLYRYSAQVGLVDKVTPGEVDQVNETLEDSGLADAWHSCYSEMVTAQTDAYTVDAFFRVMPDNESMSRFINLRHRTDEEPVTLTDDGVILTEKLATLLDVGPGDTFLSDGEKRVELKVADVTKNYIQHFIYMSDAYYRQVFGEEPEQNMVLVDYDTEAPESRGLASQLVALDGVTSLTLISDTRRVFTSSLESVDYAVILVIVCAAALAFVVLYNLTNINITERMRELATLKVLGFYDPELSAYVYRENVILTFFGVALGMFMGKLLHHWLILTVEIEMLMFGRTLQPASYGWAALLTVIFSLTVNLLAHWKLKKLDMVESLKTVE